MSSRARQDIADHRFVFLCSSEGVTVVHGIWDEVHAKCIAYTWDTTVLAIFYFYSASSFPEPSLPTASDASQKRSTIANIDASLARVAFAYDVVILLLTLYAVRRVHREQMHKRWGVGDILCIQGIGYVIVTCLVNVPVAVLAILDLNGTHLIHDSLPSFLQS